MIEKEFIRLIKARSNLQAYFLTAPKNIKLPYLVFFQLFTDKENAGSDNYRLSTTYRVEFYAANKEDLLNLAYKFKNSLNRYRGSMGVYNDVFITCNEPAPLSLGDETYRVLLETTINYINKEELQYE